jgi:hypothetical protein
VLALQRENKEVLWGSMVKETMKRKKPSFNETYYGFRTFSHLLEEAQRKGIVTLRRDAKSGSYIVEDLGTGAGTPTARVETASAPVAVAATPVPAAAEPAAALAATGTDSAEPAVNGTRGPRRRRSRGRRPRGSAATATSGAETPSTAGADYGADGDDHDHDHDDHDDMEDDASTAEGSADAGREGRTSAEDAPAPHPPSGSGTESASPAGDRPVPPAERPFSLFSWIRRDLPASPTPAADQIKEDRED